ncbi:Brix-domain-containing protein [Suhomyces tanzawaensis NRRL Y-17324]|uniref:Brix-domain-containing protein n=1 Tax=Suhomyces tanzawaensis NRRL Y-17324 TaxID=984487 RepID=A0A1E4SNJ7_9ASCO|nr:Brix-domain-containing protein [Suhomyces tanzawaensis NRRL Y-17324]ODV81100.1 Brix-domain-containing protein [Suhomyces tanzawaensis NRRL Y-17324]
MAKRRTKTRTHAKVSEEELAKIPRSMVLRLGSSLRNHSLSQLVKDFRNVMQPHTAINLRERKSNKLKDFIVMAGPLGVSDLFIFNQSEDTGNISLRMGKMPRGPTLQFKVNTYSLIKDVRNILKHPKSVGKDSKEFLAPPLLVLNGFSSKMNEIDNHEKLMITVFQNIFPPIQPQLTKVSSIKRVLMINKDPVTGNLDLRHYAINTKLVEESRNVKKLIQNKRLPNMAKNTDISDLLLDPYSVGGITSDSEVEDDEGIVDVQNETASVSKSEETSSVRKRAIKLTELGPRLNLTLVKIEEGLTGSSKTLYHANIKKSELEQKALEKKHAQRKKLREERRSKQQENLKAKNAVKEEKKARRKARQEGKVEGEQEEDEQDASDSDGPEMDPADYENDSDLYSDIEK